MISPYLISFLLMRAQTLTAKAIANEAKSTFINIQSSDILSKWMGETDKLVAALFSLARKLSPCVIFIDEVETLLGSRGNEKSEHQVVNTMQGVFLSEWDGLQGGSAPVIVLGATNRPNDLDKAFLRRMPVTIQTKVPDLNGRLSIIVKLIGKEALHPAVNLNEIASLTEGFTGSDLRELVRLAALPRIKEMTKGIKDYRESNKSLNSTSVPTSTVAAGGKNATAAATATTAAASINSVPYAIRTLRPITQGDFKLALSKAKTTGAAASDYASEIFKEEETNRQNQLKDFLKAFSSLNHNAV